MACSRGTLSRNMEMAEHHWDNSRIRQVSEKSQLIKEEIQVANKQVLGAMTELQSVIMCL